MITCVLIFEETKKSIRRSKELFKLNPRLVIAIHLPITISGFSKLLFENMLESAVVMTELIDLVNSIVAPPYAVCLYLLYLSMCGDQSDSKSDLNIL